MRVKSIILGICILFIGSSLGLIIEKFLPARSSKEIYNIEKFKALPVQMDGRIKPLDSLARSSLMLISGRQRVKIPEKNILFTPSQWLLHVIALPTVADLYSVFRVDDPDVLGLMGLKKGVKYVSFIEIQKHEHRIAKAFEGLELQRKESDPKTTYEKNLTKFYQAILTYRRLKTAFCIPAMGQKEWGKEYTDWLVSIEPASRLIRSLSVPMHEQHYENNPDVAYFIEYADKYLTLAKTLQVAPFPPKGTQDLNNNSWLNLGQALLDGILNKELDPLVFDYVSLANAFRKNNSKEFNHTLNEIEKKLEGFVNTKKLKFEVFFNDFKPFYLGTILYLLVFIVIVFGWLTKERLFIKTGFLILFLAIGVHTFGLIARMYLQGRPPVTNLYSSALFVGWVAAIGGAVFEKLLKNGLGAGLSALIAISTLIIAHNLGLSGDNLEVLRAVLDSNFWLATHVIVVTMGYSAMFFSGTIGIVYVIGNFSFKEKFKHKVGNLHSMLYGTLCFGMIFSFVGTMLGGIWADQSWGRFWGWDPKENGALLIVLWCAILLHARWGRLVSPHQLMVMAIFSNIVTSWSWFGTNMLGVGLHSYGFMDKAFWALFIFMVTQLGLIIWGFSTKDWSKP